MRVGGETTTSPAMSRSNVYWPAFIGLLVALVFFEGAVFYLTIYRSSVGGVEGGKHGWHPEAEGAESQRTSSNDVICPSALALFDNATDLEIAIADNVLFHQRGGNLRSIEKYLNGHMQNTLNVLGIQFTPNGENGPTKDAMAYLQQYYKKNKVARGGYGQPLPGSLKSSYGDGLIRSALFENRWINVIEPPRLERYDAGVGPVGPECSNKIAFSKGTYEEKTLCTAAKPNEEKQNEECNIFSIGSNDQWGFEEEIRQKLPRCTTHTFDCTLKDNTARNKPSSDEVKFYPYCIGSNDAQPPYLPYEQIWNATGTNAPPKLLKMDVEGFEYDVLDSVLSSDPSIWPEQIMMEVHWATRMVDVPWMPRTRTAAEIALFFGGLFNHGGYILANTHTFRGCQPCNEVLLIRAMCPSSM